MFTDFNELEEMAKEFNQFEAKVREELKEMEKRHDEMMKRKF